MKNKKPGVAMVVVMGRGKLSPKLIDFLCDPALDMKQLGEEELRKQLKKVGADLSLYAEGSDVAEAFAEAIFGMPDEKPSRIDLLDLVALDLACDFMGSIARSMKQPAARKTTRKPARKPVASPKAAKKQTKQPATSARTAKK